jgi:hypothetical protein
VGLRRAGPLSAAGRTVQTRNSRWGEQGTLKGVDFLPADRSGPDRLGITIEYLDNSFSGVLQIDDTAALPQLAAFLRSHLGEELSGVGSLQVDL